MTEKKKYDRGAADELEIGELREKLVNKLTDPDLIASMNKSVNKWNKFRMSNKKLLKELRELDQLN